MRHANEAQLSELDETMGQPEAFIQAKADLFDAAGNIGSPDTRKFLQGWMDRYAAWVVSHTA
ncbi:MAG: hypothetical protein JNM38_19330 [Acidobacteria bacterium]|nr:hypothetical protein [Acidobacteriota bacterium]